MTEAFIRDHTVDDDDDTADDDGDAAADDGFLCVHLELEPELSYCDCISMQLLVKMSFVTVKNNY